MTPFDRPQGDRGGDIGSCEGMKVCDFYYDHYVKSIFHLYIVDVYQFYTCMYLY